MRQHSFNPLTCHVRSTAYSFNPLPPPKRGETSYTNLQHRERCFNPLPPPKRGGRRRVSIHSPRRSEGRPRQSQSVGACLVSIHSPRRSEGRPQSGNPSAGQGRIVSIHSPRRSEGRRTSTNPITMSVKVSIHSPRRSEGRPLGLRGCQRRASEFQSTPPAEARGDLQKLKAHAASKQSFNPLPPPKRGETVRTRIT